MILLLDIDFIFLRIYFTAEKKLSSADAIKSSITTEYASVIKTDYYLSCLKNEALLIMLYIFDSLS